MKKRWIAIIAIIVLLFSFFLYKSSHPSIEKKISAIKEDLVSYQLDGSMQMLDGEDLRSFQVKVAYQKEAENDLFRVDLEDNARKQSQQIIRNQDGVFVVAPSLNRAFQFKSDWPFNSFKPYIMQAIIALFEDEYETEKIDDGYLLSAPLTYLSDPRVTHIEVVFDKDIKLKSVTLLDDNEVEIVMLDVSQFVWNGDLDQSLFKIQENPDDMASSHQVNDLPFYPLEMLGNELIDQTTTDINGLEKHILRFGGDGHFTIIENELEASEQFLIEPMSGDLLEVNGAFAVLSDDVVTLLDGDVMCQVFSDVLSIEEKLQVVSSMQNSVVIEP